MRNLLAAATALGLITASLPVAAAQSTANPVPAGTDAAKPKVARIGNLKHHHVKRGHAGASCAVTAITGHASQG